MTITTAQLRERVAEHIGVKAADIELDAENAAKIDAAIDDATAFLREAALIWWVDNAIPDQCAAPMTLIVGALAAPKCRKAGQGFEAGWGDGQAMLARIKPSAATETVRADYF